MEAILDHYHDKLTELNMSEAEVIGERNTNGHLERYSYYYICGDTRAARVLRPPLRQDERLAPSYGLVLYVVSHEMQSLLLVH